jgi:hypothetical protein
MCCRLQPKYSSLWQIAPQRNTDNMFRSDSVNTLKVSWHFVVAIPSAPAAGSLLRGCRDVSSPVHLCHHRCRGTFAKVSRYPASFFWECQASSPRSLCVCDGPPSSAPAGMRSCLTNAALAPRDLQLVCASPVARAPAPASHCCYGDTVLPLIFPEIVFSNTWREDLSNMG